MLTKNHIILLLLSLSYLLVQYVGDIPHPTISIFYMAGIFLYFGMFDFLFTKKKLAVTIILTISIIAFLYKAVPSLPIFYNNFDPGTIAFLVIMPFLLNLSRNDGARITLFIFFLIPLMVFTKNDGVAETVAIVTYLCIGLLAIRNDTI